MISDIPPTPSTSELAQRLPFGLRRFYSANSSRRGNALQGITGRLIPPPSAPGSKLPQPSFGNGVAPQVNFILPPRAVAVGAAAGQQAVLVRQIQVEFRFSLIVAGMNDFQPHQVRGDQNRQDVEIG